MCGFDVPNIFSNTAATDIILFLNNGNDIDNAAELTALPTIPEPSLILEHNDYFYSYIRYCMKCLISMPSI